MKNIDIARKFKIDFRDLASLHSVCLGRTYVVQSRLEKISTSSPKSRVELNNCSIYFEDNKYDIQLLGFQNLQKVWIWGWNETTDLPEELFNFANQIKDFSEVYFVDYARRTNYVPNEEGFIRDMTATMCSLFDDYVSIRVPAEKGGLYLAVRATEELLAKADLETFIGISNHCVKNVKMNHRLFFEGFLLWNETPYEYDGNAIIAKFDRDVRIEFEVKDKVFYAKRLEILKK